jgi:hypothetical protein
MAMEVFVLRHVHVLDEEADQESVKMIGVYSAQILAEQAIARLRLQPGFCDVPNGFHISEYPVDKDHWIDGYVTVAPDEDEEDEEQG